MDQNNIDRLFREKLDAFEQAPSKGAWAEVEKQIRPKKTPTMYWVAASVSLLLISWVIFPFNQQETFTPIAGEVTHPVFEKTQDFVLPVIEEVKKETKTKKERPKKQSASQSQFAANMDIQVKKQPVLEDIEPLELDSKTAVAEVAQEQPVIRKEVIEQVEKPEFRTVKITYIASAGNTSETEVAKSKADSTSTLKKFIAFAEKIDPGDVLADIKTAKDNLINGGLKSKKERNSL